MKNIGLRFGAVCLLGAVWSGGAAQGDTNLITGEVTNHVTWSGDNLLQGTVLIRTGAVVNVEPGARLLMDAGATLRVEGQLLADGTDSAPIQFTNAVTGGRWGRILFSRAADSRLRHCVVERADCAGDHQDYYDNDCSDATPPLPRNYHEAVVALATHLDLEACVFRNLLGGTGGNEGDALALVSDDPQVPGTASANIRSCRFEGIGQGVHTRFAYVRVEGCYFVNKHGDNDDVDLYGESTPPPLILNNLFAAPCHEDRINPTRCSAVIVGNVIAVSDDHGIVLRDRGSPVLINNVIYHCSSAGISVQNQCDALLVNNTIVDCGRGVRLFDHFDRHGPPYCLTPGSGRVTLLNCVIWDCPTSLLLTDSPDGHSYAAVAYCNVEGGQATAEVEANSTLVWDATNLSADPQFAFASTNNFRLLAGSPCIDAGTNLSAIVTGDFDGMPRPLDGNGDGTGSFDIGAFEFLLATADSNGDGIPDGWCRRYGFGPLDAGVAADDPDHDAFANLQEYVADTDPTNALSALRITAISNLPPVTVSFLSSSNRQYTLSYRANLAGGGAPGMGWTNVAGQVDVPGTGGPLILNDTTAEPARFYRVGVRVP